MNLNKQGQKNLLIIIKAAIFIATLYYIYYKFHDSTDLKELIYQFANQSKHHISLIALVIFMMPLNWGIESIKWQFLISKIEPIPYLKSFKAVLSGITINNWIPNRMAEFLGRILYIRKENRIKAIFSTLVGSYSQLIMTVIFGSIGFIVWIQPSSIIILITLLIIAHVINTLLIISFFKISAFSKIIQRKKLLKRFEKYSKVLSEYSNVQLLQIFSLSFFRYLIFLLQYFILLKAFNVNVNYFDGLIGVTLIFAVQALIPTITLTEIGIRGAVVIWVFERFSNNINGMLCAAYSLWIINIIIPTILGMIFILTLKRLTNKQQVQNVIKKN